MQHQPSRHISFLHKSLCYDRTSGITWHKCFGPWVVRLWVVKKFQGIAQIDVALILRGRYHNCSWNTLVNLPQPETFLNFRYNVFATWKTNKFYRLYSVMTKSTFSMGLFPIITSYSTWCHCRLSPPNVLMQFFSVLVNSPKPNCPCLPHRLPLSLYSIS